MLYSPFSYLIKIEADRSIVITDYTDSLFSYAQDISVDLDPSCEVDDDDSVILTEDKLTELISEVDNVRV